jgi:preprotein translocase subunit SecG
MLGLGMAVTVAPLTTVVMSSAGEEHVGAASGVNNAVARVAGVLAIAVFGIVMVKAFGSHLEQSLRNLELSQNIIQDIRLKEIELASLELPPGLDENAVAAIQRAISESFRSGYRLVLLSCVGMAAASTLVAWKLIASKEEIRKEP